MKTFFYTLAVLLPIGVVNADIHPALSDSSLTLESTPGGSSLVLSTSGESQALAPAEGAEGQQLFARADDGDDDERGKGKAKGKGKGKAKGHNKDKDKDKDTERDTDADREREKGSQPATQPPQPNQPTPAQPNQPAAAQPSQPAPAKPAERQAPSAATATRTPATPGKLSPAEVKTQLEQRLKRTVALDRNKAAAAATLNAGNTAISKETGVPVHTLEAQRKAYPVGSGGILIANELAKATGKPANGYLKQRMQGRSWVQIAEDNKVDLAPVLPKLDRVEKALAAAQPAKK